VIEGIIDEARCLIQRRGLRSHSAKAVGDKVGDIAERIGNRDQVAGGRGVAELGKVVTRRRIS
jgi:hypothetical protein